jgi:hypothetical protein
VLAARGTRNLDSGEEPVADPAEKAVLCGKARRIHVRALVVGAVAAVVAAILPV